MSNQGLGFIYFGLISCVTLIFTYNFTLDSFNLPKLVILISAASPLLHYLVLEALSSPQIFLKEFFIPLAIVLISIVVFFINKPSWKGLYGEFGRNTGLLSFVFLFVIFIFSARIELSSQIRLINLLIILTLINLIYGYLQKFGVDFINWQVGFSKIFGTFGNPNFYAAFLGIGGIAIYNQIFRLRSSYSKSFYSAVLISIFIIIFETKSAQGLFVLISGMVLSSLLLALKMKSKFFITVAISSIFLGVIYVSYVLHLILTKSLKIPDSISFRLEYWRAGLSMIASSPISGLGFSSYGEWYRTFRTDSSILKRSSDVISNSSHNLFIDLGVWGGMFFLSLFVILVFIVSFRSLRKIYTYPNVDSNLITVFCCWIGFMLQSLVSVHNIGLAVWGWALGGILFSCNKDYSRGVKTLKSGSLGLVITFLIGTICAIWPIRQDFLFLNAIKEKDSNRLVEAALMFPRDEYLLNLASSILRTNSSEEKGLRLARISVNQNPNNYFGYQFILQSDKSDIQEKREAKTNLMRLDPYFTVNSKSSLTR